MSPLVQCPGCARHIRATERECPFCSVVVRANVPATVALAVALGAAVSGCDLVCRAVNVRGMCPSREPQITQQPAEFDQRVAVPAYGISPALYDTVADAGPAMATPGDEPRNDAPAYGLSPDRRRRSRTQRSDEPR